MIRKIGILTSGGDSPGMNACIRAVTRVALNFGLEVYGIYDGYKGLVEGLIKPFTKKDVSDILARGGTILGSARLTSFKELDVQKKAVENLQKYGIDALIIIGGDGSYRGALALCKLGIHCITIPGTIDNDIPGTDFTIGFDTALNTVVEAVDKLRDTSSSHHRCSVVEVMGNRCGDLAVYSGISCGAEIVVTSETGYNIQDILDKLRYLDTNAHKNHAIVIISEKITDVYQLAKNISANTGFSGRATVLGHVQRGGSPTPMDRMLACLMGEKAVSLLIEGVVGHCVGIVDNKIISMPIEDALTSNKNGRKPLYRLFDNLV